MTPPSQDTDPAPRVLVVDDEEVIRGTVRRALHDYCVIEAQDGEEAIELIAQELPALVITDIALRRMDGCALAARIRDTWPGLPVVAISGYVDDRDVAEFEFDGFLEKPFELEGLRQLVHQVLSASGH